MANREESSVPTMPDTSPDTSQRTAAFASVDELTLARRAAQGDQHAFAAIVAYYEPRLLAFIAQTVGDYESARDLTQETFFAAFRALPRWRPPDEGAGGDGGESAHPLSPWLYRIATNQALSWLRGRSALRRRATPSHADDIAPRSDGQSLATQQTGALSFEDRFAVRDLLEQALRQLSTEDAACLVLHFVAGARYAEIGARLGLSAEAVRKRVGRGLTALRAAYAALEDDRHHTTTAKEATR